MTHTDSPMDFTDEHFIALGKLVIAFQNLEEAITYSIQFITEPNFRQNVFLPLVLNELSFASRLKLLSNFVETTPIEHFIPSGCEHERTRRDEYPEVIEKLRDGIKLARGAEENRNQILHSYWLASPHMYGVPNTVIRVKHRTKLDKSVFQQEAITPDRILSIVEQMHSAREMIFMAANHLNIWLRMQSSNMTIERDAPQAAQPLAPRPSS